MKQSSIIVILVSIFIRVQAPGAFNDRRDGQVYETVTKEVEFEGGFMASMTWLAENLNFKMNGSYAYNDSEVYASKFGRLYTWKAAMEACAKGWPLPSDSSLKT